MAKSIEDRIIELESELRDLRAAQCASKEEPQTVFVPEPLAETFHAVEKKVFEYFNKIHLDPCSGEITIDGERYHLLRSASLSYEFVQFIKARYADRPEEEALSIGNNFLYDNAKVNGKNDSLAFHSKLNLVDPIEKLSAGPVHFAFTGWANVEIDAESNPTADDDYFLKFQHHNSFEAQSWIKANKKSKTPVCTMNSGYSAGWCEESFGLSLTTVELTCEAQGDDACTFIMAPTHRIHEYVEQETDKDAEKKVEVPVFFKRKYIEEKLRQSLEQKELLIKEIHHRVKNNLQIIISLLRLQMEGLSNSENLEQFETSINRVNTMAAVHELMYKGEKFDRIDMQSYFENLTASMIQLYSLDKSVVLDTEYNFTPIDLTLEQSIPLGLILNEISCNSFKHAFKEGGEFYLKIDAQDDGYMLTIGDNGPGMTKENEEGLGLTLIKLLCEQIEAKLEVDNSSHGLIYKIEFSLS